MKKYKIRILQRIANFIVNQVKNSPDKRVMEYWYNMGMQLDNYCVNREIYLD